MATDNYHYSETFKKPGLVVGSKVYGRTCPNCTVEFDGKAENQRRCAKCQKLHVRQRLRKWETIVGNVGDLVEFPEGLNCQVFYPGRRPQREAAPEKFKILGQHFDARGWQIVDLEWVK